MRLFAADLQLHSCLSPCGSLESSPLRIARVARERDLAMIALTDHNTADNCPAFADAVARQDNLTAIYGTEVTTAEEIHVICLFGDVATAVAFGAFVRSHLPPLPNKPDVFGDQPVVDADENILRFEEALLAGTTDLPLDTLDDAVHARGGVVIAAHIDRPINSLFSQLGVWPDHVALDACDLSRRAVAADWRPRVPRQVPFMRSSDAHFLDDIGTQRTQLLLAEPSFDELRLALRGVDGRRVVLPEELPPHKEDAA